MSITDAQRDMRTAYLGGSTGLAASACAWLVAGSVALGGSVERAVIALFIGGVFIFPVSVLLSKALGRTGKHTAGNPFGALALETTAWMLMSLPLAFVVSRYRAEWFFPTMMLIIGGRYLTFRTIYGMRLYWAVGGALAVAAYLLVLQRATLPVGAFTGGAIEGAFAVAIFVLTERKR